MQKLCTVGQYDQIKKFGSYVIVDINEPMFLKYDSFKKDNQKNCWFQTCLLPSNFIVLINTDSEYYGQFGTFDISIFACLIYWTMSFTTSTYNFKSNDNFKCVCDKVFSLFRLNRCFRKTIRLVTVDLVFDLFRKQKIRRQQTSLKPTIFLIVFLK